MKFISQVEDVKLLMWEKTDMPNSEMKEVNGKKEFVKTGGTTEMTTYILRDGFGEKLVCLSKINDWRNLEGELVNLVLDVTFNDFSKKNQVKLVSITKAKSK